VLDLLKRFITPPQSPPLRVDFEWGEGFYAEEVSGYDKFRWMAQSGTLFFPPENTHRFIEVEIGSEFHDFSQTLQFVGRNTSENLALVWGKQLLSWPIAPGEDRITLRTNRIYPREYYPTDGRELSIRVRTPKLHSLPDRHASIQAMQQNLLLNQKEMTEGKTHLQSFAPFLGVDLTGVCNIKPACVYCPWDELKAAEGKFVHKPFNMDTLEEYGPFYSNAQTLVNCGIGEPLLTKNLEALLREFEVSGKQLDIATNGQLLNDKNIDLLVGKKMTISISLDAATAKTYSYLRNDKFDQIIPGVRKLVQKKGGIGAQPLIYLCFMPMKANLHELEKIVELCADLGVDGLSLRPLNQGLHLQTIRNGYEFDYEKEIPSFDELVDASRRVERACRERGVVLANQLDFGGKLLESSTETPTAPPPQISTPVIAQKAEKPSLGQEKLPLCTEPWRNFYILRRGVQPCCYGATLAPMGDYEEVWNSSLLQEVRSDLSKGKLHTYCKNAKSCPIVMKTTNVQIN
jgi:MoaA/NifB/PqqE/SkfB family radical SAM enzyme